MSRFKKKEENVGSVIMRLLKAYGHEEKLNEVSILRAWEELTGPYVTEQTERVIFKDGVVRIKISSAALRNEFSMSKQKIAEALNDSLGKQLVKKVDVF